MNPRPERLDGLVTNEIQTNDEGISYWHDIRSMELYRQDGSPTGMYFHVPRKQLPGMQQVDIALGYPREDTATDIKDDLLAEVSKKIDNVTGTLEDGQSNTTVVAPVFMENGQPAISYDVVLKRGEKTSTHHILGLVWRRLGNRTAAQAYSLDVDSAVAALREE